MLFLQTLLSLAGRISTDTLNRIITALATDRIDDRGVFGKNGQCSPRADLLGAVYR